MNKHTKLAIILAPFLAIGGYIASDIFLTKKQESTGQYLTLNQKTPCDLVNTPCDFEADRLSLTLRHENGKTILESTFPLTRAVVAWTSEDGEETRRQLIPDEKQRVWSADSDFAAALDAEPGLTIRLATIITNLHYLHEFRAGQ
ncbi:hypothetical protein Q4485_14805 [Granulosicoccaceae sp. 1_MG-2023]|nr:hypothetical protein [Granulosicoccaceae sp. 1_MG-2023]